MSNHYTQPSRLARAGYRYVYDPLRAPYLRGFVRSLGLDGRERAIDFGCGPGSEGAHLARALARGGHLTCLDVSPSWLAEARRRLRAFPNVDFMLGEAAEAGLPSGGYDLVVAHYVLHDVDPTVLPDTIGALAGALRHGGRFVVVEPVGSHHGLTVVQLNALMAKVELDEESHAPVHPPFGSAIQVVYRRR